MSIQIKIAQTAVERDLVFKLRHSVFVDDKEKRLFDQFDSFDSTVIFIATVDGCCVGSLRVTTDSPIGLPGDLQCDFSGFRKSCGDKNLAEVSWFCIKKDISAKKHLINSLLKSLARHLKAGGIENFVLHNKPLLKAVWQDFTSHESRGVPFSLINTDRFISTKFYDPDIPLQTTHIYFQDKDRIFCAGEKPKSLLAVVRGQVDLILSKNGQDRVLCTLNPGEIFGENVDQSGNLLYTAQAKGNCELSAVSEKDMLLHLEESPDRLKTAIDHLNLRIKNLSQAVLDDPSSRLSGLKLFNDYLISRVVFTLSELGLFHYVKEKGEFELEQAAVSLNCPQENLKVLLDYLADMHVLERCKGKYSFEEKARGKLIREMGFLQWLIGGYDPVLNAAESLVKGQSEYGKDVTRDDRMMAAGSANISKHFTDEHMYRLLNTEGVKTIADIGCGSAMRLIDLCKNMPHLHAVGIDISPQCCQLAEQNVKKHGLEDRIRIVEGKAEDWIKLEGERLRKMNADQTRPVDLVMCFAMFHDLLNFSGRADRFLNDIKEGMGEGGYVLIQDQMKQDAQSQDPNWCQGFELIHHFMGQRLFLKETYEKLFDQLGFEIVERSATDIPENWIYLLRT